MKRALIITNAYSALKSAVNQAERLKAELEVLDVDAVICRNDGLKLSISQSGGIENGYEKFDFCIYLDKDEYTARMLEKSGLRLFNNSAAIEVCDDKMLTHIALSESGIAMPETIPGMLCYTPEAEVSVETIEKIEKKLSYPIIVKSSYGSLGKGVFKADNRAELLKLCNKLKCEKHLFQKFVSESAGRDIRVIVIGGNCVAAMQRVAGNSDFRSNIELGGQGFLYKIDAKLEDICVRTAKILNLDYCGIDILKGKDGYLVCEVNSNAFFGGIESVTGVNIAKFYAEYIIKEVYR